MHQAGTPNDIRRHVVVDSDSAGRVSDAVTGMLMNSNAGVRREAISALARMCSHPRVVARARKALSHENEAVRYGASQVLLRIRFISGALDDIVHLLRDGTGYVRVSATQVLAAWGKSASASTPALIASIRDPDEDVRRGAIRALRKISAAAPAVLPVLIAAFVDFDPRVRLEAIRTVAALGEFGYVLPALVQALKSDNSTTRFGVAQVLGQQPKLAVSAVTDLLALLRDMDQRVRQAAAHALYGIALLPAFSLSALVESTGDEQPEVRQLGVHALGAMGAPATPAAAVLVRALSDSAPAVREEAAQALAQLELSEVIPALLNALEHPGEATRFGATRALRHMRGAANPAVPRLIAALTDSSDLVRAGASQALGDILADTNLRAVPAIRALVDRLTDGSEDVRMAAAWALGKMRANTRASIDALIDALNDSEPHVRERASQALTSIDSEEAIEALTKALHHEREPGREGAAQALRGIGARAVCALPTLIENLDGRGGQVRKAVVEAIASMGPLALPALPNILLALHDSDEAVRRQALLALARIKPQLTSAEATEIIKLLRDSSPEIRDRAAHVLASLGPSVIAMLRHALRSNDDLIRYGATQALKETGAHIIEPDLAEKLGDPSELVRLGAAQALEVVADCLSSELVDALIAALGDENEDVRQQATRVLRHVGRSGQRAIRPLLERLTDNNVSVRLGAAQALARVASHPDAIPALIDGLRDGRESVREGVAHALRFIGPAAEAAVGPLIIALRDGIEGVRFQSANALGSIGARAQRAVPALLERLSDPSERMQRAAVRAVGKIYANSTDFQD